MRQFRNIAVNAFMELIRQPVFLLLMTGSVLFEIFLAVPYYFAFGDEMKLVKTSALAVMLLAGLFGAVLSASASLAREIRTRHGPGGFVQAGRARAISAGQVRRPRAGADAAGLRQPRRRHARSWMAFDAYGSTNLRPSEFSAADIPVGLRTGRFQQFFPAPAIRERRGDRAGRDGHAGDVHHFPIHPPDAKSGPAGDGGLAADSGGHFDFVRALDSRSSGAGVFHPAGHDCDAGGLLGSFSDWADVRLFLRPAGRPRQLVGFDSLHHRSKLADFLARHALETGKNTFQWVYVGKALGYAVCYAGAALAVGVALFDERELS